MTSQWEDRPTRPGSWFAVQTAAFLRMLLLALLRCVPPDARGPDAARDEFSAGRVGTLLQKIIRPGVPHPTGSLDHARLRDAVIGEFRALGLEPEVQATFARDGRGLAEQVQNIVVPLRGTEGADAIALVAHYDSLPAGPGVADDASGVCSILEIARILTQRPPPPNDVIFLITDAEEHGLLGARAFAAEHPLMSKIRVVLNWEARGTRGPSFMSETGPDNLGLIRLMSRDCRRTISTSRFPAIYEVLPNDTDLTVAIGLAVLAAWVLLRSLRESEAWVRSLVFGLVCLAAGADCSGPSGGRRLLAGDHVHEQMCSQNWSSDFPPRSECVVPCPTLSRAALLFGHVVDDERFFQVGLEQRDKFLVGRMGQIGRAAGLVVKRDEKAMGESVVQALRAVVCPPFKIGNLGDLRGQCPEPLFDLPQCGGRSTLLELEEDDVAQHAQIGLLRGGLLCLQRTGDHGER